MRDPRDARKNNHEGGRRKCKPADMQNVTAKQGAAFTTILAAVFFVVSAVFVYRSFYGMRIESGQ